LKWTEKYFRRAGAKGKNAGQLYLMNFGGFNNPDGSLYAGHEAQQRWIASHPEDQGKFKNPDYQQKAIEQNPALVSGGRIMPSSVTRLVSGGIRGPIREKIDQAVRAVGNSAPPPFEEPSGEWQGGVESSYPATHPTTRGIAPGTSLLDQESQELMQTLWQ
jgi:hypothetical protein